MALRSDSGGSQGGHRKRQVESPKQRRLASSSGEVDKRFKISIVREALSRYHEIAVVQRSPRDLRLAQDAINVLRNLVRLPGRPRTGRPVIQWDDDPSLRKKISALMRQIRPLRSDPDLVTDLNETIGHLKECAARGLGHPLSRDQAAKIRKFALRQKVEAREIYEQVMAWRTGLTTTQVRTFRGVSAYRGQ